MTLRKDDRVRVRMAGTSDEWCEATVLIANTHAAGLLLDGFVHVRKGGCIGGGLPLLLMPEGPEGLDGTRYEIRPEVTQ